MIVCGLKLTHDGAVALLDGDRLVFGVEVEKLDNSPRYSGITDLDVVPRLLADFGYRVGDVDEWVVDGWSDDVPLSRDDHGERIDIALGPYRETATAPDVFRPSVAATFRIGGQELPYTSFSHASGHIAGAYASSPFAARGEQSYVLVWDGTMFPRLYLVGPGIGAVNHGVLFPLIGHAYAIAAQHFGPFRQAGEVAFDNLGLAGKLMAYIALGRPQPEVLEVLRRTFHEHFEGDSDRAAQYRAYVGASAPYIQAAMPPLDDFYRAVADEARRSGISDEDVLATIHCFLEELLVERVVAAVESHPDGRSRNLCFSGGCALNIKWNSALRALPQFDEVWVPPFPNDSGAAIGAAVLGRFRHAGVGPIRWHTRLGPELNPVPAVPAGWTATPCDAAGLARELHETGAPVVVLNGRAELGPRALGGRSILAAATDPGMKAELNRVKEREHYRPVAPICLVDRAPEVFSPGTPDPHMLFDHDVRSDWVHRIPAVVHLDGTARLQTVDADDDPFLHEVLMKYHALSGIPVLCNTSANFNGRGFFPDLTSAAEWGQVDRIWSGGLLYRMATAGRTPR